MWSISTKPLAAAGVDDDFTSDALAPQPLHMALESLARSAGYQIIYSSSLTKNKESPGCESGLTLEQAFQQVLRGTDLRFEKFNATTVTVVPPPMNLLRRWWNTMRRIDAPSPQGDSSEVVIRERPWSQSEADTLMTLTRRDLELGGYPTVRETLRALPLNFGTVGRDRATRNAFAPSIDLRGVGMTLVLLNGRRVLMDADGGADPFAIPISAVERIEILPEGAQALGPDAIDVVNIVLREHFSGSESEALLGMGSDAHEWSVDQILGKDWGRGRAMMSMEVREQGLADFGRENVASAVAVVRQDVGATQMFLDAVVAQRTLNLRDSSYRRAPNANLALGATFQPAEEWNLTMEGTYSSLDEVIRDDERVRQPSQLWSAGVNADHVQTLFGRDAQLDLGLEHREQTLALSRDITSGYIQLQYPLESVQLSVATHIQHIDTIGSDFIPRVGLTFSPLTSLTFRSTWSRAVKVLPPQTAETWTLGVEASPSPRSQFFVSYFDIDTRNLLTARTSGLDFGGNARWITSGGGIEAKLEGTQRLEFDAALQMRASLAWNLGAFDVAGSVNHGSGYRDVDWTTADLQLRYGFRAAAAQPSATVLSLGVQNLFNSVNNLNGPGFDTTHNDLQGRFTRLAVSRHW